MVDSTTDTSSGDDAFDAGASADELFGEFADESLEGADEESTAESTTGGGDDTDTGADGVEDQTAADVFGQLRANAENDTDEVLADESPEDIIASADDPDPEPDIDDDLRVDDDELADLLLTGRTKEKEFLWVESGESSETDAEGETTEREEEDGAIFESDDTDESVAETDLAAAEGDDLDSSDPEAGDLELEDADTSDETADASESAETALVAKDEGDVPATVEDDDGSGGVLGWLRSKLGGLF